MEMISLSRFWFKGSVDGTLSIHDLEDPVHANGDVVTTYKSVVVVNKRNKPDVAHRCVCAFVLKHFVILS